MGIKDYKRLLTMDDLAQRGDSVIFAATGVTDSSLLKGVIYTSWGARTHSLVMRARPALCALSMPCTATRANRTMPCQIRC